MVIALLSLGAIMFFLVAFFLGALVGIRVMRRAAVDALGAMNCTPHESATIGRAQWAVQTARIR